LSVALLLRYSLGLEAEAKEVEAAVDAVIEQGTLTRDLGGSANTSEVGAAVLARLGTAQKEAA